MVRRKSTCGAYYFYWRNHWRLTAGTGWLVRYRWNHHVYGVIKYTIGWRFVECCKNAGRRQHV